MHSMDILSVDMNSVFNIVNILLLCVLVKLFLLKPVHKILEKRQAMIESNLTDAKKAKDEALALEQQHKDSLKGIESEKAAAVAEAQKKAEEECSLMMTDAKQRADEIVQKAEAEASNRKAEVMRQTQNEISEIIVTATRKVTGVGGDSALYDEFIEKAGKSNGESGE